MKRCLTVVGFILVACLTFGTTFMFFLFLHWAIS